MKEVSCRVFQLFDVLHEYCHIHRDDVMSRTTVSWDALKNAQARIDWEDFTQVARALRQALGGELRLREFAALTAFLDTPLYNGSRDFSSAQTRSTRSSPR
jgi:hypothetical protein